MTQIALVLIGGLITIITQIFLRHREFIQANEKEVIEKKKEVYIRLINSMPLWYRNIEDALEYDSFSDEILFGDSSLFSDLVVWGSSDVIRLYIRITTNIKTVITAEEERDGDAAHDLLFVLGGKLIHAIRKDLKLKPLSVSDELLGASLVSSAERKI